SSRRGRTGSPLCPPVLWLTSGQTRSDAPSALAPLPRWRDTCLPEALAGFNATPMRITLRACGSALWVRPTTAAAQKKGGRERDITGRNRVANDVRVPFAGAVRQSASVGGSRWA